VAVIYTRGMVKKIKKNDTSLPCRRFCWVNAVRSQS